MKKLFITTLVALSMLTSCKKDVDLSPTSFKDTSKSQVSFIIDGKYWENTNQDNISWSNTIPAYYTNHKSIEASILRDTLTLVAFQLKPNDSTLIYMRIPLRPNKIGTYSLINENYNIYYSDMHLISTLSVGVSSKFEFTITRFDEVNKAFDANFSGTTQYWMTAPKVIKNGILHNIRF